MKLILELSMECESLAQSEAIAAAEALGGRTEVVSKEPGVLIVNTKADPVALASRLGLCHFVSEWKGSCSQSGIESCARGIEVDGPIRVRATKVGEIRVNLSEAARTVGGILGASGGVNLRSPNSDVRIVFSKRAHFGRLVGAIDRTSFEKRKNRYMPYVYPASLHPKFARALVNMTRLGGGAKLLDPFCGTGAILVEADMIGLDALGTDLSEKMVEGARRNLEHVRAKADLAVCDVGEVPKVIGRVDGIATDPPYGKSTSTKGESISGLYKRAFRAFGEILTHGACLAMVVPRMSLLDGADGFELLETHDLRVHRSLTRNFCVLKRV